jgi:hypothetical protein
MRYSPTSKAFIRTEHGPRWPVRPQVDRLGKAQQAVGDLRPYDPSFETPDEGGINGPPARGLIRVRVKPSRVQLAVSKAAHPPRSAAQAAALRSVPRGTGPDLRLIHVS